MSNIPGFNRNTSLLIVTGVYILCLAAGYGSLQIGTQYFSPLWNMFVADIVATIVVWAFSILFKNASIYDAYWSVIPVAISYYWIWRSPEGWNYKNILTVLVINYWGIRLTFNWARGWTGLAHQDWRYTMLRETNPRLYWLTNLGGIHLFPTVVVYLCMIPVYFLINYTVQSTSVFILAGAVISILATTIEFVADEQMKQFKKTARPGQYINQGLWQYSRHPNYFGEILFWIGLYIMSLGVADPYWWGGLGIVVILSMFLFASIPMMEARTIKSKPQYTEQIRRVSVLVLWRRRK
jgi:steroid 5-alpha reductase family enzyme